MKKKIPQYIADAIIKKLEKCKTEESFLFYIEIGFWLDSFCIDYLNIELN